MSRALLFPIPDWSAHRGPAALATAPLVQRGTSFDVSIPPLQGAWKENGTLLRALLSTQSHQSSFFRRL